MKRSHWFLQLAAVASSAVLMAGFVCYRAGAFNWLPGAGGTAADAGSTAGLEQGPADPLAAAGTTGDVPEGQAVINQTIIYSSKSGTILPPAVPAQQARPVTEQAPPTVISGSKSLIFVVPPSAKPPAAQTPAPAQQPPAPAQQKPSGPQKAPPTTLGGSKSAIIIPPPAIP